MPSSLGTKIKAANAALAAHQKIDAITGFFTAEYVVHLTDGTMPGGHETVRRFSEMLQRAFPELHVDVEILIESEDRVAWQRTWRGIQQGAFHGFPACDREIVWRDMVTSRFSDGLIAEEWMVSDLAERLLRARKKA